MFYCQPCCEIDDILEMKHSKIMRKKNKELHAKEKKQAAHNQAEEDEKRIQGNTRAYLVAEGECPADQHRTTEKKNILKDDDNTEEMRIRRVRAYQEVKELWSKQGKKSLDQSAPPNELHPTSEFV